MFEALFLLSGLDDADVQWIFDAGNEQQVISGKVIIQEGTKPPALYFVLEGLVGVSVSSAGDRQLATLGPGELMGEISFLEDRPATATITAVENSLLLAVPYTELIRKLEDDTAFAARLYKSFALISSRRLRERVGAMGRQLQAKVSTEQAVSNRWAHIDQVVDDFKALLQKTDEEAIKNDGEVPGDLAKQILKGFRGFCEFINKEIGDESPLDEHIKEELGGRLKTELLPYLLLTQTAERFYSKPRGYAGDFLTIEWIYKNKPAGAGRLGPLLDECFLNEPAAKAVRNRRGLLAEKIRQVIEQADGQRARVTSLACGPAQEIFDVFDSIDNPDQLKVTLIDIDLQALAFVSDKAQKLKRQRHIKAVNANLVYLAAGRQELDLPPQDLVYSIGLIDYFNDNFVIKLMGYVHGLLKPGGKLILGNFHPRNSTKALMDHILEWTLIHRTEEDMDRLFQSSPFGRPCTNVRVEEEGVNLFAECIKE
jgi:CRP-like cAMP-binding protein/SAM-dependent methyltransferase